MVILVHGTWGRKSAWAFPDTSHLVANLRAHLTTPEIEYTRYEWSGANRTSARIEAAAGLMAVIKSELAQRERVIFIIAHSHGGNIALRAIAELSDDERGSVQAVLMATPFLSPGKQFDVDELCSALPPFIYRNVFGFSLFGFWFASYVLIAALHRYIPADVAMAWLRGQGEMSLSHAALAILLFFSPPVLIYIMWQTVGVSRKKLKADTVFEQEKDPRSFSRFLVICYSQDEAFQALSVVINLIGLVHQAAFLAIIGISRLSSRIRFPGLLWEGAWVFFLISCIAAISSAVVVAVLRTIAADWPPINPLLQFAEWIMKAGGPTINIAGTGILVIVMCAGFCIVATIFSIVLVGSARIGIFTAIGVMDQISSRQQWFNALLGTVAVSAVPQGQAGTLLLDGHALINHVRIYDDERAINRIAQFIGDTILNPSVEA